MRKNHNPRVTKNCFEDIKNKIMDKAENLQNFWEHYNLELIYKTNWSKMV